MSLCVRGMLLKLWGLRLPFVRSWGWEPFLEKIKNALKNHAVERGIGFDVSKHMLDRAG